MEHVTPNQWKKHFNLIGKEKDESRKFFSIVGRLSRGLFGLEKDHGRTDAAPLG